MQTPNRVIVKRCTKQVGAMTSGERGSLVSIACAVNAIGNTIPPMFVSPRIHYQDHFVRDGPIGSIGSGSHLCDSDSDRANIYTHVIL